MRKFSRDLFQTGLVKFLISIFLLAAHPLIKGQIKISKIFNDNMVLQRGIELPVWGNSEPGSKVTVELDKNRISTITGQDGKWILRMPQMQEGGPYIMTVYAGSEDKIAFQFKNILIGDVWLASGQSNMEWKVKESMNGSTEIKNANYPKIRFFNVSHSKKLDKQSEVSGGNWEICDSANVKNFSAVAYFFARNLHSKLNVPIGIIQSTWGGTPVEAWTSREQLLSSPITRKRVLQNDLITPEHFIKDSLDLIRFWEIVYNPQNMADTIFSQKDLDDSKWPQLTMPSTFKDWNMPFYEGIIWMRKTVNIPGSMFGKDLNINLGHPEMNYSLYFNGKEICKTIWNANLKHDYTLPSEIIKQGNNTIAVRMAVLWGGGGFNPPAEEMYITDGTNKINLTGQWKYMKDLEPQIPKINNYHRYPALLYNAMINPFIPYGIKGFIWYQGEENVAEAQDYQTLFPLLINDWRIRWQQGYLPFLYVQLANYMKVHPVPSQSDWAELREAQTMTLSQPNTGMACIIDIGEENSIHPLNKQEVGRRLSLLAEKLAYQKPVQASGPIYKNHKTQRNHIIINFSETGAGLAIRDSNELKGFAIAGNDQKFYWAKAIIKDNTVIVSSEKVKKPVAVRYAWANNPQCNLINKNGLPAVPFRTDNWEQVKKK